MQQAVPEKIPFPKILAYGVGAFGWSLSINIISAMLLYVYLPPANTGMHDLVPQVKFFYVLNIIAVVTAAGRLFDAVLDPLIANWSDRRKGRLGRRIPFLRLAALPMVLFAVLLFFPPYHHSTNMNVVWIGLIQLGYYFFFGLYVIPYNALVAELGHYPNGKMQLSTAQGVGFTFGMVFSTTVPGVANLVQDWLGIADRLMAIQYAIVFINAFGGIAMLIPAFTIQELRYTKPGVASEPVFKSLAAALRNHNFRIFAIADAIFFFSIGIIATGLLYYVVTLLHLREAYGTALMACFVVVNMLMYPVVNALARRYPKPRMMAISFFSLSIIFFGIFFLGRYPIWLMAQAVFMMAFFGIFYAFPGILPNAIIAEIAEKDTLAHGRNNEGMYYGIRAFFQKMGQTAGVMVFTVLTLYGKDPGNDLGLRLSGIIGGVLCLVAAFVYTRYKTEK